MVQEEREGCKYFALIYGLPLGSVGVESLWEYLMILFNGQFISAAMASSSEYPRVILR